MEKLIILHGWRSSKEKWQEVKKRIERKGVRVFVPDLPGFKKGTELKRPWDLDDYVKWVAEYIGENVTPPFFLMGHSFGGAVAVKYAVTRQNELSGIVLASAAAIRWKDKKVLFWRRLSKFLGKFSFLPGWHVFRKFFYYYVLKRPDYLNAAGALGETFKNVINEDLRSLLPRITVPALVIWGKKDKLTLLEEGRLIQKALPNSELVELGKVGHRLHLEQPEEVSTHVVNFIKKTQ